MNTNRCCLDLKKQRDEESKREHEEWIKNHPQNESIKTWNVL